MKYIILIAAIINLILAINIFRVSKNNIQKTFGFVVLMIAIWVFSNFMYFIKPVYPYINLSYALGAVTVMSILFWTLKFTNMLNKFYIIIATILTLVIVTLSLVPDLIVSSNIQIYPWGYIWDLGPYFFLFAVVVGSMLLFSIISIAIAYKKSYGVQKTQYLYSLLGFGIPGLLVIFLDFIAPFFKWFYFASFDNLTSLVFASVIYYTIFRFRFIDLQIVIRKSIIQIITFAILFGLYAYLLIFVQRSTSGSLSLSDNTTLLLVILIIAITIEPLRRLIYKWIDGLFESKERKQSEALERVKLLSASNVKFDNLKEKATKELSLALDNADSQFSIYQKDSNKFETIHPNQVMIQRLKEGKLLISDEVEYKKDAGDSSMGDILSWLKQEKISAIIPLGKGDELIGVFVISRTEKPAVYTADKIDFMMHFAKQVEFAFASALAYKYAIERIKI